MAKVKAFVPESGIQALAASIEVGAKVYICTHENRGYEGKIAKSDYADVICIEIFERFTTFVHVDIRRISTIKFFPEPARRVI
jgi:hypothetical protein